MTILSILAALALFLVMAGLLSQSSGSRDRSSETLFDTDVDVADEPSLGHPNFSPQIVERIFSDEDRRFVDSLGSDELRRALRAERRRIAVRWIRGIAREASSIVRAHMRMAAGAGDVRVTGEMQLALRYLQLLLLCRCLVVLVQCLGPSRLYGLAGRTEMLMAGFRALTNAAEPAGKTIQAS
jgi:hypothetical protein